MYIGPQSRTERPRKTKIDTEVAHTRDSDTTFNIKRSRSLGRFSHRGLNGSGSCSGVRGKLLLHCSVLSGARRFGAHRGRRGAGHIVAAPAAYSLLKLKGRVYVIRARSCLLYGSDRDLTYEDGARNEDELD